MVLPKKDFFSLIVSGVLIGILLAWIVASVGSNAQIFLSVLNNTWGNGNVNYVLWIAIWVVIGEGIVGFYTLLRNQRWSRAIIFLICAFVVTNITYYFYINRGDFGSGGFPLAFYTTTFPSGGSFYWLACIADIFWWIGIAFFFQSLKETWMRMLGHNLFTKQERIFSIVYLLIVIGLIAGIFAPSLQGAYRASQKQQVLEEAMQTGDGTLCLNKKLFYEYEQKKCVRAVAINQQDPNICGLGGPAVGRDNYCIKQVAEAANNPKFCEALDNTEARGEYYYRCYLDFAKSLQDPNVCAGIRNIAVQLYPDAQKQCLKDFKGQ